MEVEMFDKCIMKMAELSDELMDDWLLIEAKGCKYLTKKSMVNLNGELMTFEYHVVFNVSYSVPMLCFNIWRRDGSMLNLEDYWNSNEALNSNADLYETLTQFDHPVLQKPFLALHPCKTSEILQPFLKRSKNPVISWLSVVGRHVHLQLLEKYYEIL